MSKIDWRRAVELDPARVQKEPERKGLNLSSMPLVPATKEKIANWNKVVERTVEKIRFAQIEKRKAKEIADRQIEARSERKRKSALKRKISRLAKNNSNRT